MSGTGMWWVVGQTIDLEEGERLHTCVEGRYITIFRYKGVISSIDSICHHAGGPLTLGKIIDIEDLGISVVACPWIWCMCFDGFSSLKCRRHKFLVSINGGIKAYQGVEFVNGKPTPTGWKTGKEVQRAHTVIERDGKIIVRLRMPTADDGEDWSCASDGDACNVRCGEEFPMHHETPYPYDGAL